jgi:hypothetical protein
MMLLAYKKCQYFKTPNQPWIPKSWLSLVDERGFIGGSLSAIVRFNVHASHGPHATVFAFGNHFEGSATAGEYIIGRVIINEVSNRCSEIRLPIGMGAVAVFQALM